MTEAIRDRDGLYYPYIHIRDESWLKATLLYFPHILRIVPEGFNTTDSAFVRQVARYPRNAWQEPLLGRYRMRNLVTDEAVDRLTLRLMQDIAEDPTFARRFSRAATQEAYGGKDSQFLIHRGKAPQYFWTELTARGLMWFPSELELPQHFYINPNPADWAAVHPVIGEAFMATIAAAAARDQGLEVVTDSSYAHTVVSCRDEEAIYQTLIHGRPRPHPSESAMTLRLAHLVIMGSFDVSRLKADELLKMSNNREALFNFRRYLADRVAEIPDMESDTRREARFKRAAAEALDLWRESLPSMSRFARRFFGVGLLDKSERAMTDLVKAMIPGSITAAAAGTLGTAASAPAIGSAALLSSPIVIAAGPGLAVALAIYGVKTWLGLNEEEATSSLRYLSLLKKQGSALLIAGRPEMRDAAGP
jgi:hypothetical protein